MNRDRLDRALRALLYVPFSLLLGAVLLRAAAPRTWKIEVYRVFFDDVFWLCVPYAALAVVLIVLALRARRWWAALCSAGCALLAVTAFYARYVESEQIVVRQSEVAVGAPLRVALIADLHIGLFQRAARVEQIVDALNALEVDVVVVAGDWTYEPTRPLAELLEPLKRLRHRTLSVPGNHDEEMPGPPLAVELDAALRLYGVESIAGRTADVNGVRFAGLGDRWAGKDRVPPHDNDARPMVAVAHNPDSIDQVRGTQITTMLSGHTHGGQINLPLLTEWALARATAGGFKRGLYQRNDKQVFVTSGLGTIAMPLRLFQPPVIDVLTFR
ncbi:MAG: metallophosphoesterase [Burkholderiales bacterium]|nr:metallophosphoesterase [Burkholderiales bacterium]